MNYLGRNVWDARTLLCFDACFNPGDLCVYRAVGKHVHDNLDAGAVSDDGDDNDDDDDHHEDDEHWRSWERGDDLHFDNVAITMTTTAKANKQVMAGLADGMGTRGLSARRHDLAHDVRHVGWQCPARPDGRRANTAINN